MQFVKTYENLADLILKILNEKELSLTSLSLQEWVFCGLWELEQKSDLMKFFDKHCSNIKSLEFKNCILMAPRMEFPYRTVSCYFIRIDFWTQIHNDYINRHTLSNFPGIKRILKKISEKCHASNTAQLSGKFFFKN